VCQFHAIFALQLKISTKETGTTRVTTVTIVVMVMMKQGKDSLSLLPPLEFNVKLRLSGKSCRMLRAVQNFCNTQHSMLLMSESLSLKGNAKVPKVMKD
jgi:hypothetical protein